MILIITMEDKWRTGFARWNLSLTETSLGPMIRVLISFVSLPCFILGTTTEDRICTIQSNTIHRAPAC